MQEETLDLEMLREEVSISNAFSAITKLEDNHRSLNRTSELVKWKSYRHQVVIESDNYFYKIYEADLHDEGNFNSIIRKHLAIIYESLGIHWKVISFERDGKLFDFEQRDKLRVSCKEDGSFEKILLSFSYLLDKLEDSLEFDSIAKQLRKYEVFSQVDTIKLTRCCVNKYADYGIYNKQAILLDDADFYIALVDKNGKQVIVSPEHEAIVTTSYGEFTFMNQAVVKLKGIDTASRAIQVNQMFNNVANPWFLVPARKTKGSQGKKTIQLRNEFGEYIVKSNNSGKSSQLMQQSQQNITHNIEFVYFVHQKQLENLRKLRPRQEYEEMLKESSQQDSQPTEEELLYSNNLGRKSFQWELWQCCNNVCDFCYLGKENRHTDKERQLKSLHDLKQNLEELDFQKYNNVSLIGGEFFQGQLENAEVRKSFFEVIETLCKLYTSKKIGSIWLAATLTIGDQADLYKTIEMFERAGVRPHPSYGSSGLWVCTSWDSKGRFHTEKHKQNWEFHMQNISNYYPWVKKNTTIIITQDLCEKYLAGEFVPKHFSGKFLTSLFYKQPAMFHDNTIGGKGKMGLTESAQRGILDEYLTKTKAEIEEGLGYRFFPDRRTFRRFLLKYAKDDADTFNKLFNIEFRADELHKNFNEDAQDEEQLRDKKSNIESSASADSITNPNCLLEPASRKHIVHYASYADSNACMICDRNQIFESVI